MTKTKALEILKKDGCGNCAGGSTNPFECCCDSCEFKEALKMAYKALKRPEPKTAKWIYHDTLDRWTNEIKKWFTCSKCGNHADYLYPTHFCSFCGAKMAPASERQN